VKRRGRAKGSPIPVRFDEEEEAQINLLHDRTGISKSEIIRRAIRLLAIENAKRGGRGGWIVEELGPRRAICPLTDAPAPRAAEEPPDQK